MIPVGPSGTRLGFPFPFMAPNVEGFEKYPGPQSEDCANRPWPTANRVRICSRQGGAGVSIT